MDKLILYCPVLAKQAATMKLFFVVCLLPLIIYGQSGGRIELSRYSVNPIKPEQKLEITTRVWYFGNASIQEVPQIDFKSDSLGTTVKTFVKYFLYINPDLHKYRYYQTFSDTAVIVAQSRGSDIIAKRGGWNMYSKAKFEYDASNKLTDTFLFGKRLFRYSFTKTRGGNRNDFILYSSCDEKQIPIKYLKGFSEEFGCPVIRMDTYYEGQLAGTTEFRRVSETLTQEELRIFKAWEK